MPKQGAERSVEPMQILRRHFALQLGYDISTDCWHGITLALGARDGTGSRYRLILSFSFDWPQIVWRDEVWVINEPGYIRGLPVARRGVRSSAWTGRQQHVAAIVWNRYFSWAWND